MQVLGKRSGSNDLLQVSAVLRRKQWERLQCQGPLPQDMDQPHLTGFTPSGTKVQSELLGDSEGSFIPTSGVCLQTAHRRQQCSSPFLPCSLEGLFLCLSIGLRP